MVDVNKFKKEKKAVKPKLELKSSEELDAGSDVGIPTKETVELDSKITSDTFVQDEASLSEEEINKQLEYFETLGITKTKLFELLDTLLTKGDVNWSFTLMRKIPVIFRLRPAWVNDELVKILDETPTNTMIGFTEQISKYNLASSLKMYNNIGIDIQNKGDLENALNFIGKLPYIVKAHLIKELSLFDRIIAVATSDYFIENFSTPQQEG